MKPADADSCFGPEFKMSCTYEECEVWCDDDGACADLCWEATAYTDHLICGSYICGNVIICYNDDKKTDCGLDLCIQWMNKVELTYAEICNAVVVKPSSPFCNVLKEQKGVQ
jgi:hypothetical protein